ncbi:dTMP kinase [Corynebacterium ulceribovis]|uniref:dTMP kinase n=1 Tax=Corynebacterium ulceribovis TaxID=487732 RepID=UPI0003692CFC|nr:dTMP kinase [Corynebacterium ulceribovis]
MILAIEGIDGAGKNTLTTMLVAALEKSGLTVKRMGFPAYGRNQWAITIDEALHGQHPDIISDPLAMAELFFRDRSAMRDTVLELTNSADVVIMDRYFASNLAYTAARLELEIPAEPGSPIPSVIKQLTQAEVGPKGLPPADLTVLIDAAVDLAASRAEQRAAADATRAKDEYERDGGLQARVAQAYRNLAARHWGTIADDGTFTPARWEIAPAEHPTADVVAWLSPLVQKIAADKEGAFQHWSAQACAASFPGSAAGAACGWPKVSVAPSTVAVPEEWLG